MRVALSKVQGGHPLMRIEGSAGVQVETTPRHWLARPSRLRTQKPELGLIGAPRRVPARSAAALQHLSRHRFIGAYTDGSWLPDPKGSSEGKRRRVFLQEVNNILQIMRTPIGFPSVLIA